MSTSTPGLDNNYAPASARKTDATRSSNSDNGSLDMTEFLQLMVAQFQNQSIDDTASTTDMLNQLVQISVVQAITNITDATVMTYAGSLVGKEVTVGQFDKGELKEITGTVTGTGTYGGEQVIFVDGKSYYLSEIMAVGRLPEIQDPDKTEGEGDKDESGDKDNADETKPAE